MATTDQQLNAMCAYIYSVGRSGYNLKSNDQVINAALDFADEQGFVTDDEYAEPLSTMDLREEDVRDIIKEYHDGYKRFQATTL